MKKSAWILFLPVLYQCSGTTENVTVQNTDTTSNIVIATYDYLECIYDDTERPGFRDENGDTLISFGRYEMSFSDVITSIGFVADSTGKIWCISSKGEELFEVFNYDNGPDYAQDGLFRIVKDGKIGYANEAGEVVIEPQYTCANPFENGKAEVAILPRISTEDNPEQFTCSDW